MTLHALRARALFAACLYAAPWLAFAGTIDIDKAEGAFVVGLLNKEGQLHVDAMQAMLAKEYPALVSNGKAVFFKAVRGSMHGATLARIEYSYEHNGITYKRTYHSRSGRSMAVIAKVAERKANSGTSSATESGGTDTGGTDSGITDVAQVTDDAVRDALEEKYYPKDTETSVRVAALPDNESSIEATIIDDGKSHGTDAEVKIVRRIDADIEKGVVKPGGTITGYVSKTVCESCRNAFGVLASRRDVSGTVYHLIEPPARVAGSSEPAPPPDANTAVGRSQLASMELKNRRRDYAKTAIGKNKRGPVGDLSNDVRAIELAERNPAPELDEVCD